MSLPPPRPGRTDPVLVVIPCLNEAAHLEALIERLRADPRAAAHRIVVADGGSTDGSREIVRRIAARAPNVVLLDNPDRLQSAGVNRAVRVHGGDRAWLVRVDAHADYPHAYVSRLIDEAVEVGADSVVVSMLTRSEGGFQTAAAVAQNSVLGAGGSAHRKAGEGRFVDHGHHALTRIDAYRAVGGYDESFVANEDAELDQRLLAYGARIWLSGRTTIGYWPRRTPGALWRQYLRYGEGRARTVLRHRLTPKPRQSLPLLVAPALAILPLAPFAPVLAVPALIWAGACLGFGAVLGLKARAPWAFASGLAAMVMHAAWSFGFWKRLAALRPEPRPSPGLLREIA